MSLSFSLGLPKNWPHVVRSSVLHVVALAQVALRQAHAGRCNSPNRAVELDRRDQEIALLKEELRLKDARLERIAAQKRPHYTPLERMRILELRAARGWSLEQTARAFLVTAPTVADWLRRIDDPNSLARLCEPVNKFPEFVGYLVRRLKILCPPLGKRKIAETLARAGLHLSATTVGRMMKAQSPPKPIDPAIPQRQQCIRAREPHDVWHVDLSVVPISGGFWTPWLPWSLPQQWPFCWWIAVVVDGGSRRVLGTGMFLRQPTSEKVRELLGRTIHQVSATPKYLVCDRGRQFDTHGLRRWCAKRKITIRYGAVGRHGSIAVVERFLRTLKELLRQLAVIPLQREAFCQELQWIAEWYNASRPHTSLGGRTPDEVYYRRFPACRRPRYEPRPRWPRGSPCAGPWALVRGRPGAVVELEVSFHGDRRHLPVVTLNRAA